jgi:nicotinate-nucleotide adenylyltransferase
MKIGLFFGSFNPIHQGHLIIANHILNETDIQKIWFVVSPQNPFKTEHKLLDEYNRLHLVRLAVEDDNRLRASDIEFRLPRPSYTAHTMVHLKDKFPNHIFTIIMGSDSYQNLHKWKNVETIINHYPVCVYKRPGYEVINKKISIVPMVTEAPLIQISATEIRKMIQEKKSIRYLVPDKVREEIERAGYYRK